MFLPPKAQWISVILDLDVDVDRVDEVVDRVDEVVDRVDEVVDRVDVDHADIENIDKSMEKVRREI